MNGIRFEWDEAKNRANVAKHGISFEQAIRIFDDPLCLTVPDRVVDGEERWLTFGMTENSGVLIVAHTIREETGEGREIFRIISVRQATKRERRHYEEETC